MSQAGGKGTPVPKPVLPPLHPARAHLPLLTLERAGALSQLQLRAAAGKPNGMWAPAPLQPPVRPARGLNLGSHHSVCSNRQYRQLQKVRSSQRENPHRAMGCSVIGRSSIIQACSKTDALTYWQHWIAALQNCKEFLKCRSCWQASQGTHCVRQGALRQHDLRSRRDELGTAEAKAAERGG